MTGLVAPTPVDGRSILITEVSTRGGAGRLCVGRTDSGLVVKRDGKDRAGAGQLVNNNQRT